MCTVEWGNLSRFGRIRATLWLKGISGAFRLRNYSLELAMILQWTSCAKKIDLAKWAII